MSKKEGGEERNEEALSPPSCAPERPGVPYGSSKAGGGQGPRRRVQAGAGAEEAGGKVSSPSVCLIGFFVSQCPSQ